MYNATPSRYLVGPSERTCVLCDFRFRTVAQDTGDPQGSCTQIVMSQEALSVLVGARRLISMVS